MLNHLLCLPSASEYLRSAKNNQDYSCVLLIVKTAETPH